MRRRFDHMRRRQPVAQWGFLRPHHRQAQGEKDRLEHLRDHPELRREYGSSLVLQLGVLALLTLACVVLLLQSLHMLTSMDLPGNYAPLAWILPLFVAFLGLAALRRFLRVLAEYRRFRHL
jgi:hypothetical protein